MEKHLDISSCQQSVHYGNTVWYLVKSFYLQVRYTRYKFSIQVSIQGNLNSSLCIHDARHFDEYTQVLAGDTIKQNGIFGNKQNGIFGRRGGCCPLYCIIMYNCTAKDIKLHKEVNMGSSMASKTEEHLQQPSIGIKKIGS